MAKKKKKTQLNYKFSRGPEFVLISRRNRVFRNRKKYNRKNFKIEQD